jgi:MoaA/NifB/PqqE/SkfB family radical SAM enzyme
LKDLLLALPRLPLRVDVSLDGTEATHDHIRGVRGSFAAACRTIRELDRLRRRHSHLDVGVITTISRDNQDEVAAIAGLVEQIHPDGEWMVNVVRGAPRDPEASRVRPAAYQEAQQLIEARIASGRWTGHSGHRFAAWLSAKNAARRKVILEQLRGEPGAAGYCAAGTLAGVVACDGTVRGCELVDRPMGNLRDTDMDLGRLWRGPAADQVRGLVAGSGCRCTQECFLSVNLLLQPGRWPDLVRERWRLARRPRPAPGSR